MTEDMDYECPGCGADLPANAIKCPGCGQAFASNADGQGGAPDEEEDGAPDEERGAAGDDASAEEPTEVKPASDELAEEVAPEGGAEVTGTEEPPPTAPTKAPRKGLFGGIIGPVGLTFLVLAVLAVVGTVVLMNWDVWIQGASKESIGDRQRLYVYMGVVGVIVSAIVTVIDILRRRK